MTRKSVPAAVDETAFDCPHCGAYTTQYWHVVHAKKRDEENRLPSTASTLVTEDEINKRTELEREQRDAVIEWIRRIRRGFVFLEEHTSSISCWTTAGNLNLSQCYNCKKFAVWVHTRLVDPAARPAMQPNGDMPEDIAADFNEARSIVDASPRGAAALLRLAIQKLCKHLGEKGKNIDDDIASLVVKGLNPVVQRSLDVVRVIGNEAVHPGTIDLRDDPSTAHHLFGLVNAIAEQMITHPKHVQGLYDKLPQQKRDAIDRRDNKVNGT